MEVLNDQRKNTKRMVYIDMLRIIAIFLVVFYHTDYRGFSYFTIAQDSRLFPLYLFCAIFCRIAIPVFLMISGALLLKKEESIAVVLKKRFLKFFFILLSASLILYLMNRAPGEMSVKDFARTVYSSRVVMPLWYLYTYLGFLLTLPFLRKMARSMRPVDYMYLTGIMLLFSGLDIFDYLATRNAVRYNNDFQVVFIWTIVYYPLMGDFLANKLEISKVTGKQVLTVVALGVIGVVVSGLLTCSLRADAGDWAGVNLEQYFATLIYLPACATFLGVRYLCAKVRMNGKLERIISYVGSCTFGIYLFETLYRDWTVFIYEKLALYIPGYFACLIWVICAMLLGIAITSLLKKIPVLRLLVS